MGGVDIQAKMVKFLEAKMKFLQLIIYMGEDG